MPINGLHPGSPKSISSFTLTLPSPSSESHLVLASICWEREVLLQVGAAGRPHLQAVFPSPAASKLINSETMRWGGELKGWG